MREKFSFNKIVQYIYRLLIFSTLQYFNLLHNSLPFHCESDEGQTEFQQRSGKLLSESWEEIFDKR